MSNRNESRSGGKIVLKSQRAFVKAYSKAHASPGQKHRLQTFTLLRSRVDDLRQLSRVLRNKGSLLLNIYQVIRLSGHCLGDVGVTISSSRWLLS